ncbi:MAG: YajQ family cyclic di-GMP-binding protein [Methylococcales bacterium]|nr:YajQ family cyclic di-GMP-binding protein [Methylococcales bacterium]MBT7442676.1 YajQ family cyclic di-GMP-binding protein [Methylococcales bacterium]
MPSFDIVSEVDLPEVRNAVDQTNREVKTRFDFKGTKTSANLVDDAIVELKSESEFQVQQLMDIFQKKLVKRQVDIKSLDIEKVVVALSEVKQKVNIRQGIDSLEAKKIVKLIKEKKMKVQAAIQGDKVRCTGKKRDDLQQVISMLKEVKLDFPLQYINFRD